MNWIKNLVVSQVAKLIAPKFIKDKLGALLVLLGGYLVNSNIATVEQAQALSEVVLPILTNAVIIAVGLLLNISATEKGK